MEPPKVTAGGGAGNQTWAAIRSRVLGVPVVEATFTEAAVGAARLQTKKETRPTAFFSKLVVRQALERTFGQHWLGGANTGNNPGDPTT